MIKTIKQSRRRPTANPLDDPTATPRGLLRAVETLSSPRTLNKTVQSLGKMPNGVPITVRQAIESTQMMGPGSAALVGGQVAGSLGKKRAPQAEALRALAEAELKSRAMETTRKADPYKDTESGYSSDDDSLESPRTSTASTSSTSASPPSSPRFPDALSAAAEKVSGASARAKRALARSKASAGSQAAARAICTSRRFRDD